LSVAIIYQLFTIEAKVLWFLV